LVAIRYIAVASATAAVVVIYSHCRFRRLVIISYYIYNNNNYNDGVIKVVTRKQFRPCGTAVGV